MLAQLFHLQQSTWEVVLWLRVPPKAGGLPLRLKLLLGSLR